jgi:hypothetical protein
MTPNISAQMRRNPVVRDRHGKAQACDYCGSPAIHRVVQLCVCGAESCMKQAAKDGNNEVCRRNYGI